jgi:glutaredoxin 3
MKVVIYTTNDCKFSQEEKEYLKNQNIAFEEKNLETNRDFLTEMLSISNNFAGTPVTEITKDSGEKVILKGFTKEDFDSVLGISNSVSTKQQEIKDETEVSSMQTNQLQADQAQTDQVAQPISSSVAEAVEPPQVAVTEPAPAPVDVMTQDPAISDVVSPNTAVSEPIESMTMQPDSTNAISSMPAVSADAGVVDLSQTVAQTESTPAEVAPAPIIESLSSSEPVAFAQTSQVAEQPQAPAVSPTSQTEPQSANDAQLNSVLQNLQNQANNNP